MRFELRRNSDNAVVQGFPSLTDALTTMWTSINVPLIEESSLFIEDGTDEGLLVASGQSLNKFLQGQFWKMIANQYGDNT